MHPGSRHTSQLHTDPVQRASTVVVTGRTIPGGGEPGEHRQGEGGGERELHCDCGRMDGGKDLKMLGFASTDIEQKQSKRVTVIAVNTLPAPAASGLLNLLILHMTYGATCRTAAERHLSPERRGSPPSYRTLMTFTVRVLYLQMEVDRLPFSERV